MTRVHRAAPAEGSGTGAAARERSRSFGKLEGQVEALAQSLREFKDATGQSLTTLGADVAEIKQTMERRKGEHRAIRAVAARIAAAISLVFAAAGVVVAWFKP